MLSEAEENKDIARRFLEELSIVSLDVMDKLGGVSCL